MIPIENLSIGALVVIDIQEDYTGSTAKAPFPYKNSARLIATVNQLIAAAARNNMLILYIRQEFDGLLGKTVSRLLLGGTAIKGNPGAEIDQRITILSQHNFSKPIPDAFSNPQLETFLNEQQVNELYLVGLDAAFCVHATAKGALKRGFNVTIITDGIALRAEKKWNKLMAQYEREGITLISSPEFFTNQSS